MATLICQTNPSLEIYVPTDGSWVKFRDGRLDIEDDDPNYDLVMTEAKRNPNIAVYETVNTCVRCGEVFKTDGQLASHFKDVHFGDWLAAEDAIAAGKRVEEVKAREPFPCEAGCSPGVQFPSDDERQAHYRAIHFVAADVGDDGGGDEPADISDVKAAANRGRAKTRAKAS